MLAKLKKCKTCGAELAKSAKTCPACGARQKKKTWIFILVAVVVVLAFLASSSGNRKKDSAADTTMSNVPTAAADSFATETTENTPAPIASNDETEQSSILQTEELPDATDQTVENGAASYETLDYSAIERNPDKYIGRMVTFSGRVIQVIEGWFDSVTLRIEESNGNTWYATYTHKDGEDRILEHDQITCYGTCNGVKSYTTILGNQVTLPSVKMDFFTMNEHVDLTAEPEYEVVNVKLEVETGALSTRFYGYVEILNTGDQNLYLADCTFDLEDNDGHLLQTEKYLSSCPDVIAPGETGFFYNNMGSNIDDGVSLDNGVNLVPQITMRIATAGPVDYEVSDVSLRDDGRNRPVITGRVTNTSVQDDSLFYIQVLYYDGEENLLGISGTTIMDFTVGKTESFEISALSLPDSVTCDAVVDYQVIARATHYQYN